MRKIIVFLMAAFFVSLPWAQSVIEAFDEDTVICVGLSATRGGFGISVVDSYEIDPIDSNINITGERVLTYGGGPFAGGGTTFPAFYLDGDIYTANPYPPVGATEALPDHTEYSELENVLIADWWLADSSVQFTQTLFPYSIDSLGAVMIRYSVINHDTVSHQIGVMLFLDTNIDGVDDAPFVYTETEIESTRVMSESEIPPYFQIYEIGPWVSDDSQTVARILLDGLPNIKPNHMSVGDMRTGIGMVVWDLYVLPTEPISDGGAILQWGVETIAPGEGINFTTTYGLAPTSDFIGGPLGGRIEMPRSLNIFRCVLMPNPLSTTVLFRNNTDSTMYNIYTRFDVYNSGISLDPDSLIFLGDSLLSAEIVPINWTVSLDSLPETDTTVICTLRAWAETVATGGVMDTIETKIPRTIIVPGATYLGPTAEVIYPLNNTFTSNMYQPICIYLTDDDTTVAPLSIRLGFLDPITGDTLPWEIRPGLGGCTYENDTLYYPHEIYRSDGERVTYYLRPTYDFHGCPLNPTVNVSYTVDLTPPELGYSYWYPADTDTVLEDSLAIPWINVEDRINKIDTLSVSVTIVDDESTHTHYFTDTTIGYYDSLLTYDFDTSFLYIVPLNEGWRFPDGFVRITLDSVCDAPDYGEPNCATFTPLTWGFIMNAHGPRAYPRTPDDGWFVSIPSPDITFYLYDGNGIDPSSVSYSVDGTEYSAPASYGWHDSLIVHTPTTTWSDGYVVDVAVISAVDSFGKTLDTTSHPEWSFTIDMSPPVAALVSPAEADTISNPAPTVEINLYDAYAGVDESSITLIIDGVPYTTADASLTFDSSDSSLVWDGASAGADLSDSVIVCLDVSDLINMGDPNELDTCFYFYVNREAPLVAFEPDAHSICSDDAPMDIIISDEDGVADTTIVITIGDDTLTLDDSRLSYDGTSEILEFDPAGPFWGDDGDSVTVCVISAADIYGNAISSPVCRTFIIDLEPPIVTSVDIEPFTHSDHPGILDSTAFHFYYTNTYGEIDSYTTYIEIYSEDSTLLGSFSLVDFPSVMWMDDDSAITFSPGTLFTFEEGSEYNICFYIEDNCYAGYHDVAPLCTLYYASDVTEKPALPIKNVLLPNYPDPFNSSTVIPVSMGKMSYANISIYDIDGKLVYTLWNDVLPAGITNLRWNGTDINGRNMPSGIYFVRLKTPTSLDASRISLIK